MPIYIRDDLVYVLLRKIDESDRGPGPDPVKITKTDLTGMEVTPADLLGHLDFLNQEQYINAEFSGNAYGNQEDVPDAANPKEFDFRIANTFGSSDGPLPHLIEFEKAELTEKGRKMLEDMEAKPPKALQKGPSVPILDKDRPFLEKVMVKGSLPDLYDARDLTEVVFRVMRDLLTKEASDRVESELHEEVLPTDNKALQMEISDLWHDTNPLVAFVSRFRPPLHDNAGFLLKIDDDRFLFRVANEGGLPPTTDRETVVKAVFSATKDELSPERIQEVAEALPGVVRKLWEEA
ncbi:DUF2267 domain-containing protein [Leptolyngbya ohadii]|uniref:DUF2267 domain-containing protein n=1 Tax=Leptolyngbya ohadii TaxID=1962290 RepID=UPI000B5995D2|nr:DUF2267 domain-containing protein [Leptolyngbya ohadii]